MTAKQHIKKALDKGHIAINSVAVNGDIQFVGYNKGLRMLMEAYAKEKVNEVVNELSRLAEYAAKRGYTEDIFFDADKWWEENK